MCSDEFFLKHALAYGGGRRGRGTSKRGGTPKRGNF